jgi:hypothetical protein
MMPIASGHGAGERFPLTHGAQEAHYRGSPFVMMTRTPARAAVLTSVAVRLSLLVLLLGILPGGFTV